MRALVLCALLGAASAARADDVVAQDKVAGGTHWRIHTSHHGAIHVFAPAGFRPDAAGVVVYVHCYFVNVDAAWREQKLVPQFVASGRNALFIVPEAPDSATAELSWPDLGELLRTVQRDTGIKQPAGSLVVVGHSGAYRNILPWLSYTQLTDVLLLDAFYGGEADFRVWLTAARGHDHHHLTLVTRDTHDLADRLVASVPGAATADRVPERFDDLTAEQKAAPLLNLSSQYDHMGVVVDAKAMPILLLRAALLDL